MLFDGSTPASEQPDIDTVPSAPKPPTYQVSIADLPDTKVQEYCTPFFLQIALIAAKETIDFFEYLFIMASSDTDLSMFPNKFLVMYRRL